jgi:hypothetical protein
MFRECGLGSFLSERQIRTKMWTILCLKRGEIMSIKTRGYVAFVTKHKAINMRGGIKIGLREFYRESIGKFTLRSPFFPRDTVPNTKQKSARQPLYFLWSLLFIIMD